MGNKIFVYHQGKQLGPFPRDQMAAMFGSQTITDHDLYWCEGLTEWQPLASFFRPAVPPVWSAPPLPSQATTPVCAPGEHPDFWRRLGAHLVDSVICVLLVFGGAVMLAVIMIALGMRAEFEKAAHFLFFIAIALRGAYYALFESSRYQATPGKLLCRIVVTDLQGKRLSVGRALGRFLGMYVSLLTLCIGYLMCAFTERKQCLHDLMAGCLLYVKPINREG